MSSHPMTARTLMFLPAAAAALALLGCDPSTPKEDTGDTGYGTDCTAISVASTTVTVVNESGEAIADPELSFVAGEVSGACEPWVDGGEWNCGWDISGPMTITGDAWGYSEASVDVDIAMDAAGCHPIPEAVTLTLPYLDCTTEIVPSVIVTVTDTDGAAITGEDVEVQYYVAIPDKEPAWCIPSGDTTWYCGEEQSGPFEIVATAEGYSTATAEVTVEADECHVITEFVDLELEML